MSKIFKIFRLRRAQKTLIFGVFGTLWEFEIFKNFPPAAGYQNVIFS
tara:strand:- start:600 stop:740 length:141 start_codon:yes stop_codon:yes gene_type:complete